MKILVTGGSGNIGKYVVAELARAGHEVVSFDQSRPKEPVQGARYRLGDHEDLGEVAEVCQGVEAIAHLSAIPAPRTHPNATVFRSNVMGTFNVHEAAAMMGVPLVVSTSSQSAFGFAYWHRPFYPQYLPLDEDHPDLSQDAYGLSKMVGEEIAHGFHRRNGMRVCSIRPPWVVQPEQYEHMQRWTAPRQDGWHGFVFAYLDVRDLAVAYRVVIEAPPEVIQDEVFNVAADDSLTAEPLAELLPRLDPAFKETAAGLTGNQSMVSSARIKQKVGWQAAHSWRDHVSVKV